MATHSQEVVYSSKPNSSIINLIVIFGLGIVAFLIWAGLNDPSRRDDLLASSVLLTFLTGFVWVAGSIWAAATINSDSIVLIKYWVFWKTVKELKYSEVASVELSEYFLHVIVKSRDGKELKIPAWVDKVSGDVAGKWTGSPPFPTKRAIDLHLLRDEIQRRSGLLSTPES